MFLHADADGYKLDAQHDMPIEGDDLPGSVAAFNSRADILEDWRGRDEAAEWTEKWWFAEAEAIRATDCNLSASRYRPMSQAQAEHRDPLELLDEIKAIEQEILEELDALSDRLREASPAQQEAAD
jgi:type I restriction enzyme M protein